jgi:hypothetical protein
MFTNYVFYPIYSLVRVYNRSFGAISIKSGLKYFDISQLAG